MDGVLVGAGSLWPVNRIFPCQKSTHDVLFAREITVVTTMVAMSSMHLRLFKLVSTQQSPLASKRDK
jgi:hypothetical protein